MKRSGLGSLVLGLSFVFNTSSVEASGFSALSEENSYWQIPQYKAVFEARSCPETGICGQVYAVDPQDSEIRKILTRFWNKVDPPPSRSAKRVLEDEDILSFCGFSPNIEVRKTEDNFWYGSFKTLATNKTYTVRVTEQSPDSVRIRLHVPYLPFIGISLQAQRVEKPEAPCVATREIPSVFRVAP